MKRSAPIVVGFLAAFVAGASTAPSPALAGNVGRGLNRDQQAGLPNVIYRTKDPDKYPIWVAAEHALSADGSIAPSLFSPEQISVLHDILTSPPEQGCVRVRNFEEDIINPPSRTSLEQATQTSRLVILGKVTAKAYGFHGATPGQLLRVSPEETVKGTGRNVDAYYIFVPSGAFSLAGTQICKTDSRYPAPPEINDEVMLFVPTRYDWDDQDGYLDILDDGGIVTIRSDSTVILPSRYRPLGKAAPQMLKSDLVEHVRRSLPKEDAQ